MEGYENLTWEDIGQNDALSPIVGLGSVSISQIAEHLGCKTRDLSKTRLRVYSDLDRLGMFTGCAKQFVNKISEYERLKNYTYRCRLANGEYYVIPNCKISWYPAPAAAKLIDEYRLRELPVKKRMKKPACVAHDYDKETNDSTSDSSSFADNELAFGTMSGISDIVSSTGSSTNHIVVNISGVECYEKDGVAYLKLETVARGLGFTEIAASGNECVKWSRVRKYLVSLNAIDTSVDDAKLPDFIPENVFYRLAMKAKNATAEEFQAKIADDVIPSIRKYGAYMTPDVLKAAMSSPEFLIGVLTALKNEQDKFAAAEQNISVLKKRNEAMRKENLGLAKKQQTWDYHSMVNRLVRIYGRHKYGMEYIGCAWSDFYRELYYKEKIDPRSRIGDGSILSRIRDNEWPKALAVALSMCRVYDINMESAVNLTNCTALKKDEKGIDALHDT